MCLMMGAARDGLVTVGKEGAGTGAGGTVGADGELKNPEEGVEEVGGHTTALEGEGTEAREDIGALCDTRQGASRRPCLCTVPFLR